LILQVHRAIESGVAQSLAAALQIQIHGGSG
jgi:hypothetical protein